MVNKGLASLFGVRFDFRLNSDSGQVLQINSVQLDLKDADRKVSMKKDKSSSKKMLSMAKNAFSTTADLRRRFHLNFLVKSPIKLPENVRWELVVRKGSGGLEMARIQGSTGKKRIRRNLQRAQ